MFEKIKLALDVFRKGKAIENAVQTKNWTIVGSLATAFLGACVLGAKGFGYDIPLTDSDLVNLGGTVGVLCSLFFAGSTVATSEKVGLPAKSIPGAVPSIESGFPELVEPNTGIGLQTDNKITPEPAKPSDTFFG